MLLVVLLHALLTGLTAWLAPRLGPKTFLIAALGPASGVGLLAASAGDVLDGRPWTESYPWVPGLDLQLAFRLDGLSWLMLVLVCGIGTVIFVFTAWYAHRDPTLTRFVATLTAFAGAMFGLVLADDMLLLYVFWELTSVTSFLLVGLKTDDEASRRAALQALLITMLGGLAMLAGLLILASAAGTSRLTLMLAAPPQITPTVQVGLALVLLGGLTKSAQAPFHIWLPGAMAAPTPVSAYLHAAAMVKAGIYLFARFSPAFAEDVSWWRPLLVTLGGVTMLIGGWRALRQHDLKRLLAFSTVSQLGFLTIVAGWGSESTRIALGVLLLAHGLAKASLFLGLGALDHETGVRDLRRLNAMARAMPLLAAACLAAALSMGGVPLFLGFIAKEAVLEGLVDGLHEADGVWAVVGVGFVVVGSVLTLAYALRFWWGAFARKPARAAGQVSGSGPDPDGCPDDLTMVTSAHAPGLGMSLPVSLLAVAGLITGVAPALADAPVGAAAGQTAHLTLWHGFTPALGLSVLALTGGALLFVARRPMSAWQNRVSVALPDRLDADLGYERVLRTVNWVAAAVTGRTQIGSLTFYLGVIITVAVTLPGVALILGNTPFTTRVLIDSPAQVPVVLVITVAALLACLTRVRLTAVLLLGAVGYGISLLYVLQGAPDLAMTQLLVETLSLVVFLFVLRLLPKQFPRPARVPWRRAGLATAIGVLAATLTLLAASPDRPESVAAHMLRDSYTEAHGRNVVNVILVDFRGLDTLGEATVVLVAALGLGALVLTARRPAAERSVAAPPRQPSHLLRVAVRVAFHPILVTALFFLFSGHNNPGGGFIGGLFAGAAFVLRYLSDDVPRASQPLRPVLLLGLGLLLASGTALAPMLAGADPLTSGYLSLHLPVLGKVGLSSVLAFDTGVFLVVVGLTLLTLNTLGSRRESSLGVVNEEVRL